MADGQVVIQVKSNAKQAAADFNQLDKSLDKTEGSLKGVDKQANKTGKAFDALKNNIGKIGIAAGIAAIGIKLKDMATAAIQTGIAFEALDNKFKAAAGSLDGAERSIGFVTETTEELGIAFKQTADAYAGFVASATRSGLTFKQTEDIFKDVATAATALQLPAERVDLVFRALEQIASKGVVSMEELKLQLGDSLPGAVQIAAKSMDVTNAKFLEMVSNGEVLSNTFLPKFAATLRNELGGSAEDAAQSLQASINRSNNAYAEFERAFAERTSFIVKGWNELKRGAFEFATALVDIDRRPKMERLKDEVAELSSEYDSLQMKIDDFSNRTQTPIVAAQLKEYKDELIKVNNEYKIATNSLLDLQLAQSKMFNSEGGGEGGVVEKETNKLKELQKEAAKTKIELQNLFLSGQEDTSAFEKLQSDYNNLTKQINDAKDATKGFQRQTQDSFDIASEAADAFSRNAARSLFEPWQEGETAADRFKNIAVDTIKDILAEFIAAELKKAAVRLAANIASGGFASFTGFATGGSTGSQGIGGEKVTPYANGGIVGNGGGVVSQPTFFRNNGQLSVAGEVSGSPEGILPLERMRNGDMGVQANVAPVINNIYNNAPVDVQVVSRPNNQNDIFINNLNAALANSQTSAGVTDALSRNSQSGTYAI